MRAYISLSSRKKKKRAFTNHAAHLPSPPVDRLRRDDRVQDLELGVADGLVAERPLAATPLETLHDALATGVETVFVHLVRVGCIWGWGGDGLVHTQNGGQGLMPRVVGKV